MASVIVMFTGVRGQAICAVILTGGYLWIVNAFTAPAGYSANVTGSEGLLHDWVDVQLLAGHLYRERPDPEGILSTLPAIATVLAGVLTGQWVQRPGEKPAKLIGLFVAANLLLVGGLAMNAFDPINKKLWSSSYVVLTAGLALHFLAMCFWLVDIRGRQRWATPFLVLGSNAIVAYTASSLGAVALGRLKFTTASGELVAIKTWIYKGLFAAHFEPLNASLLYALSYVALWIILLAPLYWRRIFIKI
jgi:predicted acyltransferase